MGDLSGFNIWSEEFSDMTVRRLAGGCAKHSGTVVAWADLRSKVQGGVKVKTPASCGTEGGKITNKQTNKQTNEQTNKQTNVCAGRSESQNTSELWNRGSEEYRQTNQPKKKEGKRGRRNERTNEIATNDPDR